MHFVAIQGVSQDNGSLWIHDDSCESECKGGTSARKLLVCPVEPSVVAARSEVSVDRERLHERTVNGFCARQHGDVLLVQVLTQGLGQTVGVLCVLDGGFVGASWPASSVERGGASRCL